MSFALEGDYWEIVRPTYIENWPEALTALSIQQVNRVMTRDDAITLGKSIGEFGEVWWEQFGMPDAADSVRYQEMLSWLDYATHRFPNGGFVRLGSRSPKDSWDGHNAKFRANTGAEAWRFLTDLSERIHDDLSAAIHHDYEPNLWVREWRHIPPEAEFRCFMRERELVGISQYESREFFTSYSDTAAMEAISHGIREWFFPRFRDACPLDSVVFDVFLDVRNLPAGFTLLEINPFIVWTDPCMFTWRKPEMFDGRFLYRTIEDKIDLKHLDAFKYAAILDSPTEDE